MIDVRFDDDVLFCQGFRVLLGAGAAAMRPRGPGWKSLQAERSGHHFGNEEECVARGFNDLIRRIDESGQTQLNRHTGSSLPNSIFSESFGLLSRSKLTDDNAECLVSQSMLIFEDATSMLTTMARRRPIAFTRGFLVWSAHEFDTEDIICILLGCDYPVILRPVSGHYKVIGECYIYVVMQGEALSWLGEDECPLEEFGIY
jgi:hypothetical protein